MEQAALQSTSPITGAAPAAPSSQPGWWAVGAAAQGISHERLSLPCQDAFAYRLLESGLLLVAVADGAGTAQFSQEGARLAVEHVVDVLEGALALPDANPDPQACRELLAQAFESARQAIWMMAEEQGQSARDYAATLACVIASPDWLAAAQVGDGAIVADTGASDQEDLRLVVRLQRGEYANETQFITQADALEQMVVALVEQPVRAFAVMSDGLIRLALKMPSQEPHAPFFQPLFRFAAAQAKVTAGDEQPPAVDQLAAFLRSERVNARTDDDKTLVLAIRIYHQEQPESESELERDTQQ